MKLIAASVSTVILFGCSHMSTKPPKSTSTKFDEFIPPKALRTATQTNQLVVVGTPVAQPLPTYPEQMLSRDIARRTVCLSITINRKGVVYNNHPLYGMLNCPANAKTVEPVFLKAAQAAVMRWRFYPTLLCTFPKGTDVSTKGAYCELEGGKVQKIPIKLAFKFTFKQSGGKAEVHIDRINHGQ